MNIKDQLLREHGLETTRKIARFAIASKQNFACLMDCFISAEYRLSQRAAAAVAHAITQKVSFINDYIPLLVELLSKQEIHQGLVRNCVRILQLVEIPEEFHADLLNRCFTFIEDPKTPAAIKAFSLTILHKLSKLYPEVNNELQLIIDERWETEKPAFRARARKIIATKYFF